MTSLTLTGRSVLLAVGIAASAALLVVAITSSLRGSSSVRSVLLGLLALGSVSVLCNAFLCALAIGGPLWLLTTGDFMAGIGSLLVVACAVPLLVLELRRLTNVTAREGRDKET